MPPSSHRFLDRFWSKVAVADPDECWEWMRARSPTGYGAFAVWTSQMAHAHRLSWILTHATDVPDGLHVCHRCDNPPCCNPAHLFLGTMADNMADKVAKARSGHSMGKKGEEHSMAKLKEAEVRALRNDFHQGGLSLRRLAAQYGVSRRLVQKIVHRKLWTHVP